MAFRTSVKGLAAYGQALAGLFERNGRDSEGLRPVPVGYLRSWELAPFGRKRNPELRWPEYPPSKLLYARSMASAIGFLILVCGALVVSILSLSALAFSLALIALPSVVIFYGHSELIDRLWAVRDSQFVIRFTASKMTYILLGNLVKVLCRSTTMRFKMVLEYFCPRLSGPADCLCV